MKAWSAMDYSAECGCIVYAETRGKARALAMGAAGLDDSRWQDIEVRRLPGLDGKRDAPCALDWRKDARMYYEAGWHPAEGAVSCDSCSRYEYEEIPESRITETEDGNLCAACLAQAEEENRQGRQERQG